jgi:hypothetical protein
MKQIMQWLTPVATIGDVVEAIHLPSCIKFNDENITVSLRQVSPVWMRSRVATVQHRLSFGLPSFFYAVDEHDSSRLRSRDRNAPALDTIL